MKLPLRILALLLKEEDRDEILGDLEERYQRRLERQGRWGAGRWLWHEAFAIPAKLRVHAVIDQVPQPRTSEGNGSRNAFGDAWRDVRFGFRSLRRRPVFALTATITLAVGIGMTTTMFTLVDAVILRPLPGSNTEGMVYLGLEAMNGELETSPTPELLRLIRDHGSSFSRVEAYAVQKKAVRVDGEFLRVRGGMASSGFFSFLGVEPSLGRGFRPGDSSGSPVVLLSNSFWREQFGERRSALGETIVIEGVTHEIVGVLPRDFRIDTPAEARFWVPEGGGGSFFLDGVALEGALALLREGVSMEAAREEMEALIRHNPLVPRANLEWTPRLKTPADLMDPNLKRAILLLQAGALLVLFIALGNLANLLLVQGEARDRELAVRASLGAGRFRLVRQLLLECGALWILGSLGGILLTLWGLDVLPLFLPPGYGGFALNPSVVVFSVALTMLSILGAGILPALKASQRDLSQTIKGITHRGREGRQRLDLRQLMVSVEVAMALVLLVTAGLLLKSFAGLTSVDVGFHREDLMTLRLELPSDRYEGEEARLAFYGQLENELETRLPSELAEATLATGLVEGLGASMAPVIPEGSVEDDGPPGLLLLWGVAADYFDIVGVPLDQGRPFSEADGPDAEAVVIVNREVARRQFPDGSAVGKRLKMNEEWYRVIGVAGSINLPSLAQSTLGDQQLYFPLRQRPSSHPMVLARVLGDPVTVAERLRESVRAIDPTLPVQELSMVEDALAESLSQERSNALLMALFGVTALVLGAVGIYGVVAYTVGRQIREIGIRVSLGATQAGEITRVVRGGMRTVALGLLLGAVGIGALEAPLSRFLYEVDSRDPWILAMGTLSVAGAALLSTWLPARRAATSAPVDALREE